ncbi:MAG: hypothetical protein OEM89_01675, partial [Nitrosopumilus sp.]|nr:hypothetical protein [Nitrosopumilus sp.]
VTMEEYCSLDESERDAFIEEHKDAMKGTMSDHKDAMKGTMSDHKDAMKGTMSDHKDAMKGEMSDHKDAMKGEMSDHKDAMRDEMLMHKDAMKGEISDHKSRIVLRASTLTDEQKNDIKTMHSELRDFKHLLRDSSSDLDKEEIRNQFMEKAKEFSMTWLSPRHQTAAGIDAKMVQCHEGFSLVMKTSNATPMCVKESTAEKLIERGFAITAI